MHLIDFLIYTFGHSHCRQKGNSCKNKFACTEDPDEAPAIFTKLSASVCNAEWIKINSLALLDMKSEGADYFCQMLYKVHRQSNSHWTWPADDRERRMGANAPIIFYFLQEHWAIWYIWKWTSAHVSAKGRKQCWNFITAYEEFQ